MINRVKRMLVRAGASSAMDAYFRNVSKHADHYGPTFAEAQRDFRDMSRRYSKFPN